MSLQTLRMEPLGHVHISEVKKPTGELNVQFVAAKSRVAPLKELTIPRLELQAAVLASRLCKTIENEVRIQLKESILFTDSAIVLA